ncbi:MAG: hypothetical protein M1816_001312 [Peltula sp. TS41687]|nr:MAG: hypothetical protein M1816_001312 [Peltula sp. TS41687]
MAPNTRAPSRRSSRKPSPAVRNTRRASAAPVEPIAPIPETAEEPEIVDPLAPWVEPPLRPPAPSWADFPGGERTSATANMQPLGTPPSARVRAAAARPDPFRRYKKGCGPRTTDASAVPASQGSAASEDVPSAGSGDTTQRNSEAPSTSVSTQVQTQAQEEPAMSSNTTERNSEAPPTTTSITSTHSHGTRSSTRSFRSVSTPAIQGPAGDQAGEESPLTRPILDRAKMQPVIEAAVANAVKANHRSTGAAMQQLYEESRDQPDLLELLDAVLNGRASVEQHRFFKTYINAARQASKDGGSSRPPVSKADKPKPAPVKKSTRVSRPTKKASEAALGQNPATGRSRSGSSSSSLSSLESSDYQELFRTGNADQEPQLHNFSTSNKPRGTRKTGKRSAAAANLDDGEQGQEEGNKRPKMAHKRFEHIEIPESGIRGSLDLQEPEASGNQKRPAPEGGDEQSTTTATRRPSRAENGERPAKRAKTARTKMSPVKNKKGVIAGVARSSATPVGIGGMFDEKQDDNNDYCSACGGEGSLVCCDGCPRSFHVTCLDPPADIDSLPEPWFCPDCTTKKAAETEKPAGLFGGLVEKLDQRNPVAYNMDPDIRYYFEHVSTGKDGEYQTGLRRSKHRSTFYEAPSKETAGKEVPVIEPLAKENQQDKIILCFKCGKGAYDRQKIVQCDFCPLYWHLDCVDPPIPHFAPRQGAQSQDLGDWMCPAHVDHDLEGTDPSYRLYSRNLVGNNVEPTNRTTKVRKPKNAKVIDVGLKGDSRNRGIIEIENEPSDNEQSRFDREAGATVRIPEKRIKMDFIAKIHSLNRKRVGQAPTKSLKRMREEETENQEVYQVAREQFETERRKRPRLDQPSRAPAAVATNGHSNSEADTTMTEDDSSLPQVEPKNDFSQRPLMDQQVALNLVQLAQATSINLGGDEIGNLLNTLIAEAPQEVVQMMSSTTQQQVPTSENEPVVQSTSNAQSSLAPAQNTTTAAISDSERQQLLMLQELIRRRLG